jgi:hypothetical protein
LVCGSRTFDDRGVVFDVLQGIYERHSLGYMTLYFDDITVIDGAADGADTLAYEWASTPGPHPADEDTGGMAPRVLTERYPADWTVYFDTPEKAIGYRQDGTPYNRWAGPQRNSRMLEEGKPDLCVAFLDKPLKSSRGTKDMVEKCRAAGVKTVAVWVAS